MKNILLILFAISFVTNLNSQANLLNAKNPSEIGKKQNDEEDKSLEYAEIDDSDILWSKVVYEFIDLNEKLNFPLLFPTTDTDYGDTRKSLWKAIRNAIENGEINEVYDGRNDNFLQDNVNRIIGKDSLGIDNFNLRDLYGSTWQPGDSQPQSFAGSGDIVAYRIKGVWFFDKKHSELKYRLLGLMPVGKNLKSTSANEGGTGYFWLWYPQIREILSKHKVFNDKNNNNRISFDDLLVNRRFSSFIYKYNNVYGDREIKDYIVKRPGESDYQHHLRILLESERIKKQILDFEVDMWGY